MEGYSHTEFLYKFQCYVKGLSDSLDFPEQCKAKAASLKLIKIQTVLMKCAVNLRVSFAQNNTESEFHSNKTITYCKNKWEKKNARV